MDQVPADQKLIVEHPELVDPMAGGMAGIPPAAPAPATPSSQPAEEPPLPKVDEPAATATEVRSHAQEAAPARRKVPRSGRNTAAVRKAIPKGAKRR